MDIDDFETLASAPPEPLHPDLQPYLHVEGGLPVLKHPYIFSIPHGDGFNAVVNAQYRHKVTAIADAKERRSWKQYVYLHERPFRRMAFVEIVDELDDAAYWELLRSLWIDAEFVHEAIEEWSTLFTADRSHRDLLMTSDETAALAALPEAVTVYRGVDDPSYIGLSWTTDPDKASWFARRWGAELPVVLQTTVAKVHVLAFITARGESEVLIDPSVLPSLEIEEAP